MTILTLATRNYLVQDPQLVALLGRSTKWLDGWVFDSKPSVTLENTERVMIVITQAGGWQTPNPHNTMRFPRLCVDVWADPSRNADHSVQVDDAEDKIEKVFAYVARNLHTTHLSASDGKQRMWGTQAQIMARTGVPILSSQQLGEVEMSAVSDGNGIVMGRAYFGITTYDTLT